MKMNPWTLSVLLLLAGPLGADPDWHVEYPESFCVVEGSTATIPCSFTHPKVHKKTRVVVERVGRVVWCPNHLICQGTTPNVYNSSNVRADSRFLYPGDHVRNCTLKIIKTEKRDAATYRFRFETNAGGWTGQIGVRVKVTDGEDVKVRSSVTDNVVKEGGQVTLTCTSVCSFHQLDVHWYRNGHALSETGPALHLSNLTNDNAGNYTCSLDSSGQKTSVPWCLLVGEYEDGEDVKVRSSVTDHVVKEGGQVTLTCTSACSFHQLDVHWYRNGHALSETGPALHLSNLTNDDAGNYTCSLDSSGQKTSAPWCLLMGEYEDGEVVKVRSSITDHVVKEGGQVTLTCTSACSFHQLDVHWYRNGHNLSETGPALHLSNLTNDDAGDYTCSLDSSWLDSKTSAPWSLGVVVDEGKHNVTVTDKEKSHWLLTGSVVSVVLAVFLLLLAGVVFAKRRQAQKKASDVIQKLEVDCKQEAVGASEEEGPYTTMHPWTCNHGDHILTTAVVLKETQPISPPPVQVALITRHREAATEQMKMNPWTPSVLLLLAGPLGADPDWHVEYPDSFCVVEGSTATIPCSFTHPKVRRVERVVWCPNHLICHLTTPNVYDSINLRADSRFLYLGDLVRNCTLKIIKTVKQDAATYRFRFETNGHKYTGPRGVRVRVTDGEDVKVRSSVTDHVVKEGSQVTLTCTSACSFHRLDVHCGQKTSAPWCLLVGEYEDGEVVKVRSSVTDHLVKDGGQVTLTCTSAYSFHQLDVHWYRNGHALSEKGPALHLSNLTNDNTGNYTCSLDSSGQKTSAPWSLVVVEDEGFHRSVHLVVAVVKGVVLAVLLLLLAGAGFAKWCSNKTNQM
ncbi:unnamed protein product [Gadus morhua 'NCC']